MAIVARSAGCDRNSKTWMRISQGRELRIENSFVVFIVVRLLFKIRVQSTHSCSQVSISFQPSSFGFPSTSSTTFLHFGKVDQVLIMCTKYLGHTFLFIYFFMLLTSFDSIFVISDEVNEIYPNIKHVHIIFMTHLDLGFTNFTRFVLQQYYDQYFPAAIKTAEYFASKGYILNKE